MASALAVPRDTVLYYDAPNKPLWVEELRKAGVPLQVYPDDVSDLAAVRFAVAWNPPPGLLQKFPNLQVVQSLGAGVDCFFMQEGQVPEGTTLLRITDPLMGERMAMWVLWGVINHQRRMDEYLQAQRAVRWDKGIEDYKNRDNQEVRCGLMGLGVMGGAVASMLVSCGYPVSSWTRSGDKALPGVVHYGCQGQLKEFVQGCDVLICMLPLTPQTRGILDATLLSWLPRGAYLINGARGAHLVEADLIQALDSGQVSGALLDVFATEPLPDESPLWGHAKVRITPHVASMTNVETAVEQVARNRELALGSQEYNPAAVVDMARRY